MGSEATASKEGIRSNRQDPDDRAEANHRARPTALDTRNTTRADPDKAGSSRAAHHAEPAGRNHSRQRKVQCHGGASWLHVTLSVDAAACTCARTYTPTSERDHDITTATRCRSPFVRGGDARGRRLRCRNRVNTNHHDTGHDISRIRWPHDTPAADNHCRTAAADHTGNDHRPHLAASCSRACPARGGGTDASGGGRAGATATGSSQRLLLQLRRRQGRGRRAAAAGRTRLQIRAGPR